MTRILGHSRSTRTVTGRTTPTRRIREAISSLSSASWTATVAEDAPDRPEPPPDPLAGLGPDALLDLRGRIDAHLPALKLTDLNLETEIVIQYQQAKALLGRVIASDTVPTNQKAQVANSCTAILDQLSKMQIRLYSSERFKAIEQVLIKALRTLPTATQEQFFVDYERLHAEET